MQRPRYPCLQDALNIASSLALVILTGTVVWALVIRSPAAPPRGAPARAARPALKPLPVEPISIEGATRLGSDQAKVALITYSEFKCPFCGVFARDTLPKLNQHYVDTGKVLVAFRHFPLDSLHPFARRAAEAADCANQQGKFLVFHDELFKDQPGLNAETLAAKVKTVGLDAKAFDTCMANESVRRVEQDVASGRALGVTGTPTFFVGLVQADKRVRLVQQFSGAKSFEHFKAELDRWVLEAEKSSRRSD